MQEFDVAIIGAGAAGLFCAGIAGQRGLRVLLLDHSEKIAEKIRISGGGRCNFTNSATSAANFISANPRFCRSALARYTPQDFIALLARYRIAWHEKHLGQLFCDRSAQDIIDLLLAECALGQVTHWQPAQVQNIRFYASSPVGVDSRRYQIDTSRGLVGCHQVVIASGGLSIPAIGASDFGYRMARQFGLELVTPRPALVPLTFDGAQWAPFAQLAGLALPVHIGCGSGKSAIGFAEDLLFTHRGLSGPAILQISSYWQPGSPVRLNLAPALALEQALLQAKAASRKLIANELAGLLPARLADAWTAQSPAWQCPINQASDKTLAALAQRLAQWEITPSGSEGYKKAEVTAGGVDTRCLSSQTMESTQPGLYFIGEVVDVTGWLGGYNFQWAWASAFACAKALRAGA